MNLQELLTLKALELKQLGSGDSDLSDRLIEQQLMKGGGAEFRNMCAHLSVPLCDEIDSICGLLGISKRRFVEGALIEAVKMAKGTIAQVGPFELEA